MSARSLRASAPRSPASAPTLTYDDLPRRLNRVTVAGDIPVCIDGRQSRAVKGNALHYSPVAGARATA